jgi:hypothetical protein
MVVYAKFDQHLNSSIKIVTHSESYKNYTIRQKIAVVAAIIHNILFSHYGNCRDKIQALSAIKSIMLSNLKPAWLQFFNCRQIVKIIARISQIFKFEEK